jgi:UDP:flavonoid glycosyltransferase YjiC (YdhE family)
MRISIAALGTRGDVQPLLALGLGLRAAGHAVTLLAGANFERWVTGHGLGFAAFADMEALMSSEDGLAWTESSDNPLRQVRSMRRLMDEHGDAIVAPLEAAAATSDLLVSAFVAQPFVQAASEATGVPYVNAMLQPQHPTRSGPSSLLAPRPRAWSVLNRWAGVFAERIGSIVRRRPCSASAGTSCPRRPTGRPTGSRPATGSSTPRPAASGRRTR